MPSFEDFFASKYEQLETENKRLSEELRKLTDGDGKYGPHVFGPVSIVKVKPATRSSLPDDADDLRRIIAGLEDGRSVSFRKYYSTYEAVDEGAKECPWSVKVVLPNRVISYAVTGDGEMLDIPNHGDYAKWDDEELCNIWIDAQYREDAVKWAFASVLEDARKKLEELSKKAEEEK